MSARNNTATMREAFQNEAELRELGLLNSYLLKLDEIFEREGFGNGDNPGRPDLRREAYDSIKSSQP